jgi:uncharacterized membrane protein
MQKLWLHPRLSCTGLKTNRLAIITATLLILMTGYGNCSEFIELGRDLWTDGVSADGNVVVGWTRNDPNQAYVWCRDNGFRMLGSLPGHTESRARSVSADGSIVVGWSNGDDSSEIFLWTEDGGMAGIGTLPGFDGARNDPGISDDGSTVVGTATGDGDLQAFRWTQEEGFVGLIPAGSAQSIAHGVSADGGIIAVASIGAGGSRQGSLWAEVDGFQSLGPSPQGLDGVSPWQVSADGRVIVGGDGVSSVGSGRPFRWTNEGGIEALPHLTYTRLLDISPDGSVVIGVDFDGEPSQRAFVWDVKHGTRDLRELLISEHGFAEKDLPLLQWATGLSGDTHTIAGTNDGFVTGGQYLSWVIYLDKPLVSPLGDFNDDHYRDVADIDLLSEAILAGSSDGAFDLNSDGLLDESDRQYWVSELADTFFGDANLDGEFNSGDLVAVFEAGQYEDGIAANSGWATGDWNGDGEFNTSDLVLAFRDGGYEYEPRGAPGAVPEPSAVWLITFGVMLVAQSQHFRRDRR